MEIPPQLDKLSKMNASDLRKETERLRGASAMTVYRGTLIPKGGLQKKDEADAEETKKKALMVGLAVIGLYFFYTNFM